MAKPSVTYQNPPSAPPAQGLYSHVARMKLGGDLAFIAGQLAIDKAGKLVGPGDVGKQLNAIFDNMGALLKDLGADFGQVVQFTTYLTSADLIPAFMTARAFSRASRSAKAAGASPGRAVSSMSAGTTSKATPACVRSSRRRGDPLPSTRGKVMAAERNRRGWERQGRARGAAW